MLRSASRTGVRTTRLMIQTLAGTMNSSRVYGAGCGPVARAGCGGCITSRAGDSGQNEAGEPAEVLLPVGPHAPAANQLSAGTGVRGVRLGTGLGAWPWQAVEICRRRRHAGRAAWYGGSGPVGLDGGCPGPGRILLLALGDGR